MIDLEESQLPATERARRLTRAEYDRLVDLGFFDDERVELLYGRVMMMSPANLPHTWSIDWLTTHLVPRIGTRARVRIQSSFVAADESEPEPDVAIVPQGDYSEAQPSEAFLIIEVADSSLLKDRQIKAPLYAASNVREYWIVNVLDKTLEVYRNHVSGQWRSMTIHAREETVAIEAFPDVHVRLADFIK